MGKKCWFCGDDAATLSVTLGDNAAVYCMNCRLYNKPSDIALYIARKVYEAMSVNAPRRLGACSPELAAVAAFPTVCNMALKSLEAGDTFYYDKIVYSTLDAIDDLIENSADVETVLKGIEHLFGSPVEVVWINEDTFEHSSQYKEGWRAYDISIGGTQ
jgi:hypothetical protein